MIDFELTEGQKMLRQMAHEFAEKEIRPIAMEVDADPDPDAALRTKEVIMHGLRLGFGNLLIPEKYGGYGGSLVDWAITSEELAWGDAGIALNLVAQAIMLRAVYLGATDKQREKWLRYICEDTTGDRLICGCQTEPTGGCEIHCPLPNPELGMRTTAVRDGNYYVINGEKCFITGPKMAKVAFITARTDKTKPNLHSQSLFLVLTDTLGFKVGKAENKMGHRAAHCCEVTFEDMRVPAEDLVGAENAADAIMAKFRGKAIGMGAKTIGFARAMYEEVLRYANERVIWGKPVRQIDHVGAKLVDMATKIEAMRAFVWLLAWAEDHPEGTEQVRKLRSMAKVFPISFIRGIAADAFQIMGGYAYIKPALIEKLVRDTMVLPVTGLPNELLTSMVARGL